MLWFWNLLFMFGFVTALWAMIASVFVANWPHALGFLIVFLIAYVIFCALPNPGKGK